MKFKVPLGRRKQSPADVNQKEETSSSDTKIRSPNLSIRRWRKDAKTEVHDKKDQDEKSSGPSSRESSPLTSPKRKLSDRRESIQTDTSPLSPKHTLSTLMSSVKRAAAWSEMTSTSVKVPTIARIVWLANRSKWLALDQLLDKLFLDEAPKVDLNIEASLLGQQINSIHCKTIADVYA
eukprot:gene7727-13557_t